MKLDVGLYDTRCRTFMTIDVGFMTLDVGLYDTSCWTFMTLDVGLL